MVVGHAERKVRKAFTVRGLWSEPGFVELQAHLVVRKRSEQVRGFNQLRRHVDVVSTVDDHGVERLEIFQARDTHHLNG